MDPGFEETVKEILGDVKSYGLRKFGGVPKHDDREGFRRFMAACHEGFYRAQDRILEVLPDLEDELLNSRGRLKEARRARDRIAIARATLELSLSEREVQIIRKLADTMAWTILGDEEWAVRRHFMDHEMPMLRSSNISSVVEVVNRYRQEDPDGFALVTDITSLLQIGDLLIVSVSSDRPKLRVVEVKEGEVNDRILDFLESYAKTQCDLSVELFMRTQSPDTNRQLVRTVDQSIRVHQVMDVLSNGRGTDPVTGQDIVIDESEIVVESWDDELLALIEEAKEKGWATNVVDDALLVGVYSDLRMQVAFDAWLAGMGHSEFISIDLRAGFNNPTSRPLFMRPLGETNLLDIAMGRLVVRVAFDMRSYCKKIQASGASVKWVDQRHLQKHHMIADGLLMLNHKYLMVDVNGSAVYLGGGLVGRVLFSGVRPDTTISILLQPKRPAEGETRNV